ncbi:MAG: bifunctional phosphoribosylaminoimidazolecarboxamide formyltransferase/IMP cyclohydrolase [Bdellovibrionales bacterium]|jgi:phosphoribosylaminoimidazolecarboxamide formyltransferase/IMP cyclohydrolase|nr:bifunctional phosphoribosylaminoimidazolecarboxamide formyltransferase/IMP cyclohydrolase [Bdellovibrionales bacterium]
MSTPFKNALVSVSDKTGLVEFLKPLVAGGLRVVSTGGTLKHLQENGIPALDISEQTGFPEVMGGRVKTLHPRVHMALLSREGHAEDASLLKDEGLAPFDLLIVNLYPFEAAKEKGVEGDDLIEFIDIGGPSMLRSAAKNHARLTVICDPQDYEWVRSKTNGTTLEDRRLLAAKVFSHTSRYDDLIARSLSSEVESWNGLNGRLVTELRYGENPHQKASWYRDPMARSGLHEAQILHGKPLSYNNLLDLDAACAAVTEFRNPAAVAVKHNNPCGVGTGVDPSSMGGGSVAVAVRRAIAADPVSVFGGIIAFNRKVDFAAAEAMASIFLECVIAPGFDADALERLKVKKDLRILSWPGLLDHRPNRQFRTIAGGYLVQTADRTNDWMETWKIMGPAASGAAGPSIPNSVKTDLLLAWKVCAHLRSNAIAIVNEGSTVGLGMGQVNRVDAVEQAIARMRKHHPNTVGPVVLASDAFFPFADSMELIAEAGIRWVIQPGGSIRDSEVLSRAEALGISTVLTGTRHFRH